MFSIEDSSIFQKFEDDELQNPSPRKEVDGRTIYVSRELEIPSLDKIGPPVLCDFGSAVFGDELHTEDVQPDVYRSPEVILKVPWDYRIDIWNTGCMVNDPTQIGNNMKLMRIYRFGIYSKEGIFSTDKISKRKPTVGGLIWPK